MNCIPPCVRRPTLDELEEIAARHHIRLSDTELETLANVIDDQLELYEQLDELPTRQQKFEHTQRSPGYRPASTENPNNAFITKCEVVGAEKGPLAGYTVGVKDSIAVAGVEMTCGSKLLEGYVPSQDATVITRLLDAGTTITAKTNMEDMAWSGSGELSAFGPVTNPRNAGYLAAGSSGGSAAAVAAELVDVALGTDQGGSVRMPASWCGIVGLKPTHGLVPYTGTVSLDATIDHLGPLTRDVTDCARVLDVIAGPDGRDHRQRDTDPSSYTDAIANLPALGDLTIGVLEDGFGREESEPDIDETVAAALDTLADAGATVRSQPVSWHRDGGAILTGIAIEGTAALARNDGISHFTGGVQDPQFARAFGRARRTNANDFPPMMKLATLLGQYLADEYQGQYYAKAQNLVRELQAAYDEALGDVDVLALPTTPQTPHEVRKEATLAEVIERSLSMNGNTSPFNGTGHPAISIPCGTAADLPVGLMLVGNRFDDATVLQTAKVIEDTLDVPSDFA